ncbi:disease resistance protein RUN1 [Rosa chinensis]|uniref:disease resistance protein RUN1 n=1 Tax=Rosa chinensis TaxID=74649 RepID=UPI001AD8DEE8|nr:disease resistance protein RUN1 [Rosa chinensis]
MASASSRRQWKYDVFLNFRGEDTRYGITDHLYTALAQRGIITFRDDPYLDRGKSIRPALLAAIEESRCAIVILSRNYASSSWCLDELVKIIQCMKDMGQQVLPVFFWVDPSDVRHQTGSFELKRKTQVEVTEHEEVHGKNENRLNAWRAALTEVANLSGWDFTGGYPTNLIDEIVNHILKKSVYTSSSVDKGFIGMNSRIDDLFSNYICPRLGGVRFIGIHGMRGIGKTTLARAIHDEICQDFDRTCFLSNVREMSKKNGLVSLQEKLLSRILVAKIENIDDEYTGAAMIERQLCRIKVLVVIDDVDQLTQLEKLAGSRNWFGPGTRIIITTTDFQLLKAHDVDATYKANGLNCDEALQLLSLKAFKKCPPPEDYLHLCYDIIGYAQGLPLALVVLGSFLFGRSADKWASAIDRLKNTPDKRIIEVLRISFDGLDEKDQEIFLHIACFYKGKDKDRVTQILDYCQLDPVIGSDVLADRSLISISNNELSMHDLLQELGWEIVREQSPKEPGKRSRLWSHEDINNVLKKNKVRV